MNDTDANAFDAPEKNGAVIYKPTDEDPFGLEAFQADRAILNSQTNGFGGGLTSAGNLFKFPRGYRTGKLLGQESTEKS